MANSSSFNTTTQFIRGYSDDESHSSGNTVLIQLLLCCCLFLVSMVGNGFMCFLLLHFKRLRTLSNILMSDSQIIHLINVSVNVPLFVFRVVLDLELFRGKLTAWLLSSLHVLFAYLTLTTMFITMIDRFLAIQFPCKYRVMKTKKKILLLVVAKWFLTFTVVLSLLITRAKIVIGEETFLHDSLANTDEDEALAECILCVPILLATICLYLCLRHTLGTNEKRLQSRALPLSAVRRHMGNQRGRKALNTILITIIIFCFCYVPSMLKATDILNYVCTKKWLIFVPSFLHFVPSVGNVFIHFGRAQNFQMTTMMLWHSTFFKKKESVRVPRAEFGDNMARA